MWGQLARNFVSVVLTLVKQNITTVDDAITFNNYCLCNGDITCGTSNTLSNVLSLAKQYFTQASDILQSFSPFYVAPSSFALMLLHLLNTFAHLL